MLGLILELARDYGRPPMRVPAEPGGPPLLAPRSCAFMKTRMRAYGVGTTTTSSASTTRGSMTEERVLRHLGALPEGTTEMYFHAATGRWPGIAPDLAAYQLEDEFAALISPRVADAVRASGAERIAFRDLADAR